MDVQNPHVGILGISSYAPETVITNEYWAEHVDTSDEWIVSRTGIHERRFARDDEYTSDMVAEAITRACKNAGCELSELDYIVVATASPDMRFPNTAAWASKKLGTDGIAALDISTACSGFLYAIEIAESLVASGKYKRVAAVGAEKLSSIMDKTDRSTCVLFGDGAGCAIVGNVGEREDKGHQVIASRSFCNFNWEALYLKGPGSRFPISQDTVDDKHNYIRMNGREVYRFVVSRCVEMMQEALEEHKVSADDISLFIPHQANANMLEYAAGRAGIPPEKMFLNIQKYGNTSSASIPLALDEANEAGRMQKGDLIFMIAFGGGLSSAYSLLRW